MGKAFSPKSREAPAPHLAGRGLLWAGGAVSHTQGQVVGRSWAGPELGVSFLPECNLRFSRPEPRQEPQPKAQEPNTEPAKMVAPSELEHSMEKLMLTFHKFAGEKNYLNRDDLQKLMECEFSEFLKNQNDPMAVDKIIKDLDDYRDGKVTFHSFFSLIAGLLCACNEYYVKYMKH
ncbi:hypothetical protein XENTR_v10022810 [Xenopus tropicalis]|uniref:Protein S100-A10 n=2 Tax=Xenopus tropicalis TaxID=8364 RepID=A0A803JY39_XENTR|nr:protein S100-A10 isoform X2 [Xenopus tropicalis]KAE8588921.1 hypothetical protein XENTR_v10022810 [Xenopus tropicalis]